MSLPRAKTCCDILFIENILEKKNLSHIKWSGFRDNIFLIKYEQHYVIELKAIAKQHGIEGYYKPCKAELIHKLEAFPEVNEQVLIPVFPETQQDQ